MLLDMEYRRLGRTGLEVSVMGFGCGGPSRAGVSTDKPKEESVRVIRRALDEGVNFVDTAEAYGTEDIVGEAIAGRPRHAVVISTKKSTSADLKPSEVERSLENSLRKLRTEYIDVYHMHGVRYGDYDYLCHEILPVFEKAKQAGKIRFIGITESFGGDPDHLGLQRAVQDDCWDVMMVGFNVLNQTARDTLLVKTREMDIGVLIMFAIRRALSRQERLREVIAELVGKGEIESDVLDRDDPLGFLVQEAGAASVPDACYRFCRDEPGTHVILSGTGSMAHLEENLASFRRPPLPDATTERLRQVFRNVVSTSAN